MKIDSKILFDRSIVWMALVVGIAAVVVADQVAPPQAKTELFWPLEKIDQRDKKLTFGLFVTPDPSTNPIDPPERFTGYHSALDLEILPGEENVDAKVFAACDGKVLLARESEGYGGLI